MNFIAPQLHCPDTDDKGDGGTGLPEVFVPRQSETLGMKLVHALAMQPSGAVEIDGTGGARVRVAFPDKPA